MFFRDSPDWRLVRLATLCLSGVVFIPPMLVSGERTGWAWAHNGEVSNCLCFASICREHGGSAHWLVAGFDKNQSSLPSIFLPPGYGAAGMVPVRCRGRRMLRCLRLFPDRVLINSWASSHASRRWSWRSPPWAMRRWSRRQWKLLQISTVRFWF